LLKFKIKSAEHVRFLSVSQDPSSWPTLHIPTINIVGIAHLGTQDTELGLHHPPSKLQRRIRIIPPSLRQPQRPDKLDKYLRHSLLYNNRDCLHSWWKSVRFPCQNMLQLLLYMLEHCFLDCNMLYTLCLYEQDQVVCRLGPEVEGAVVI